MQNTYDVIIVGAGPAGLECTKELANSELSVLLLEKNSVIGPKICAGGLTGLSEGFDIPADKTRTFVEQHIFINNKKFGVIPLASPLRTITRHDLGQYRLSQIQDTKNITILTDVSVKKIDENAITTQDGTVYHFRYLVGADGSNSLVRKYLKLPSDHGVGIYYDSPKMTDNIIWYVYPKKIKSSYIWVFPQKDYTNVGIAFNPKLLDAKVAKEALNDFMQEFAFPYSPESAKGSTINFVYRGCEFGNIFLAGDAAGLIPRGTGEGIPFAMVNGKEVAKKILDPTYTMPELKHFLKIKQRQDRMFDTFEKHPRLYTFHYKLFFTLLRFKRFQKYFGC